MVVPDEPEISTFNITITLNGFAHTTFVPGNSHVNGTYDATSSVSDQAVR